MRFLGATLLLIACGDKSTSDVDDDTGAIVDADGDGFFSDEDCDDTEPQVNPEADEYCDGIDNDCDGATDESDALNAVAWYRDTDGDGFGDPTATSTACQGPPGYVADATDCDDENGEVHPDADEICNDGLDNDCDGDESSCYLRGEVVLENAAAIILAEAGGVRLATSLSGAGDVDGDGLADVFVGLGGWVGDLVRVGHSPRALPERLRYVASHLFVDGGLEASTASGLGCSVLGLVRFAEIEPAGRRLAQRVPLFPLP